VKHLSIKSLQGTSDATGIFLILVIVLKVINFNALTAADVIIIALGAIYGILAILVFLRGHSNEAKP